MGHTKYARAPRTFARASYADRELGNNTSKTFAPPSHIRVLHINSAFVENCKEENNRYRMKWYDGTLFTRNLYKVLSLKDTKIVDVNSDLLNLILDLLEISFIIWDGSNEILHA
jgi:hypothetical protein